MELRQLEAFVAVAEERNFTRAAARLHLAQSGLSATVRSLEKELRALLFVRSTRRVDLTPAGAALLPDARRTLASALAALDAVAAVEGLQRGALTLGVMQAGWLFDLAGILARYRAAYPGISVKLQHASTTELQHLLHDGAVDITFAPVIDEPPPTVAYIPLAETPLVACTTDPQLGRRGSIALAEVVEHQQLGYPADWGVTMLAARAFGAAGVHPRVDLEVNDTDTLLDLVEAGLGIALIPEALLRNRPHLRRLAISDGRWNWAIGAQTAAPAPINPAARALWAMLNSVHPPSNEARTTRRTSTARPRTPTPAP